MEFKNKSNAEQIMNNDYTSCETTENNEEMPETSNPNLASDTDPADDKKMKGDAIGETMYSERYVLKTLLQLMDIKWNDELENDLCCVWDMTTDKDVVDFLLQNNFIELSLDVIKDTNELRLIEIMVGIIGNMCVYPNVCAKFVATEDIDAVLSLINMSDTPILIQLMRLYKALLFCDNVECNILLTDTALKQVNFIMSSSQNCELLLYTMQVAAEIINKNKESVLDNNFVATANEAFKELAKGSDKYITRDFEKCVSTYLKILENMCTVLETIPNLDQRHKIINNLNGNGMNESLKCIENILRMCSDSNWQLLDNEPETVEYFLYCTTNFMVSFHAPFHSNLLVFFMEVFVKIDFGNLTFETDVCSNIVDFLTYMVVKGDENVLKETLKDWPKSAIVTVLVNNIMEKNQCSDNFINKVNSLCS